MNRRAFFARFSIAGAAVASTKSMLASTETVQGRTDPVHGWPVVAREVPSCARCGGHMLCTDSRRDSPTRATDAWIWTCDHCRVAWAIAPLAMHATAVPYVPDLWEPSR